MESKHSSLPCISSSKSDAAMEMSSGVWGRPLGKPDSMACLQMSAVWGAPIDVRASTTNATESELLFENYCENPPLLTSASSAQMLEKTLCGSDCAAKSRRPKSVLSDSERSIRIAFLSKGFIRLTGLPLPDKARWLREVPL